MTVEATSAGAMTDIGERLSDSQLVSLFDQPDSIVCFNGELIPPSDGLTEESITESACRALSAESVTDCLLTDGTVECRGLSRSKTDRSSNE